MSKEPEIVLSEIELEMVAHLVESRSTDNLAQLLKTHETICFVVGKYGLILLIGCYAAVAGILAASVAKIGSGYDPWMFFGISIVLTIYLSFFYLWGPRHKAMLLEALRRKRLQPDRTQQG